MLAGGAPELVRASAGRKPANSIVSVMKEYFNTTKYDLLILLIFIF
jgi:hypothetical protein